MMLITLRNATPVVSIRSNLNNERIGYLSVQNHIAAHLHIAERVNTASVGLGV